MQIDTNKLIQEFWRAPDEAMFDQKTVAAVTCHSTYWCERMRWSGGGIPYTKNRQKCLYRKMDVIQWLNQNGQVHSTSEYKYKQKSDIAEIKPRLLPPLLLLLFSLCNQ